MKPCLDCKKLIRKFCNRKRCPECQDIHTRALKSDYVRRTFSDPKKDMASIRLAYL